MSGGMNIGRITGGCQRALGFFGLNKGNGKPAVSPNDPQDDCCEIPKDPFKDASSNPFDLYARASNYISRLLGAETCVENGFTNSILTGQGNPNFLMIAKFKIMALLGRMYDYLKYLVQVAKADKEATKDAYQVGFAA